MQNSYNSIESIARGSIRLFTKQNALLLLTLLKNDGMKLLGIDAFILHEDKTQPSLEHSIDFSTKEFQGKYEQDEIYRMAKEHVENLPESLYCEIVY